MTSWRTTLGSALAVALLGCAPLQGGAPGAARGVEAAPDAATDAAVARALEGASFNGAIVLTRRGQVVYSRGFGLADREAQRAFTPQTPADGASLAKTFTAAAVHLLVAEGRLSLDDLATKYLPGFPHPTTRLRHLIGHSDGLPDYDVFNASIPVGKLRTAEMMLRELAASGAAPAFVPGTRFEYSNLGFDVAALIVERVTGQRFEAYVRDKFFAPLGFEHSFGRPAFFADWPSPRTIGYRQREGQWQRHEVVDGEDFLGASNFYFSATDLSRWAMAFAQGRLPAPVLRAATATARLDDGRVSGVTLGSWYCYADGQRCQYSGSHNAFYSVVHWDQQRNETVAFVSTHTLAPWLCARLARELIAAAAGQTPPPRDNSTLQRTTRDALPTLAGSYRSPTLGVIEISAPQPGRLQWRDKSGLEQSAFRVTTEVFYVPGLDLWFGFSGGAMVIRSMQGDERAERLAAQLRPDIPNTQDLRRAS